MLCSYRSYSTSCMVGYSFIIFFGIFLILGEVYAKDPFEMIIKKHMVDVEKYKTKANAKELMFKLIVINRDIGEYYKKGYDYKKNNIFKIFDLFIDDYNLEYPDAKLSEEYIRDYKKDLKTMMNSLPADFFINIVLNYLIYLSHIDFSNDRISINSFDPLDVGITIALIGTALYAVPNVYCRSIATVLILGIV